MATMLETSRSEMVSGEKRTTTTTVAAGLFERKPVSAGSSPEASYILNPPYAWTVP